MLRSTTMFAETATVAGGAYTTINKTIDVESDNKGNPVSAEINKKKAVISTTVSAASTTGLNTYQDWSYNKTMSAEQIENVYTAQAYLESLTNSELEELLGNLDLLEKSGELEKTESKTI